MLQVIKGGLVRYIMDAFLILFVFKGFKLHPPTDQCRASINHRICAGILEQSMGTRNRVGIGLSDRPARLHRLAESIPGLHKSLKFGLWMLVEND
jgi:hypothetical protein